MRSTWRRSIPSTRREHWRRARSSGWPASCGLANRPETSIALIGKWTFEGHALVSADDRIADAHGDKPAELNHPKDWKRFQAELGKAAVVLIGRKSHEA